jgi:hypothetical protein
LTSSLVCSWAWAWAWAGIDITPASAKPAAIRGIRIDRDERFCGACESTLNLGLEWF